MAGGYGRTNDEATRQGATDDRAVAPHGTAAAYEIVNLCGRVIARTANASDANREGAVRYAAERAGASVVAVTAGGSRLADENLYEAVHAARLAR